jgi:hypothetical protein
MIQLDVFLSVFLANFLTIAFVAIVFSASTLIRIHLIDNQTNPNHD